MRFCVFSSGSKQNCFYLESDSSAILVDMGLSFRALRLALKGIGRDITRLGGVFISHEHGDHTRGLPMLSKHTPLPIYLHPASRLQIRHGIRHVQELQAHTPVTVGDLTVQPFPVSHDAANTFGFRITHGERALFLASDLGYTNDTLAAQATGCHAIAIEANYDPLSLRCCGYPPGLQSRISGPAGHLSNDDAVAFLHTVIGPQTEHVFLLHLSDNSNSHAHVQQQIDTALLPAFPAVHFYISHRDQALPLVTV